MFLSRRTAVVTSLLTLAVAGVGAEIVPKLLFTGRIAEGLVSGHRAGRGTWGSAFDLIMERPLRGHGYGDFVYHTLYNASVANHPDWFFKTSIGPHNLSLTWWFAGGILGLVALWGLFASIAWMVLQAKRQSELDPSVQTAVHMLFLGFLANVVIRGFFETVSINLIGLVCGCLLALLMHHAPRRQIESNKLER